MNEAKMLDFKKLLTKVIERKYGNENYKNFVLKNLGSRKTRRDVRENVSWKRK